MPNPEFCLIFSDYEKLIFHRADYAEQIMQNSHKDWILISFPNWKAYFFIC